MDRRRHPALGVDRGGSHGVLLLTTRYANPVSSTRYQARPEPANLPLTVRLGISWLTNALVLLVVTVLLTGVTSSGAVALLLAAAVFGVLNTVLKPLLRLITLPLAVLTLGIAWFFVSMLMLLITKWIVSGFDINGFWTLVAATLIVWVVNLALDFIPGPWQVTGKRRRRNRRRAA
jgi:putative membrane protein